MLVFALLLCGLVVGQASAAGEGDYEFEHSPNGERTQRSHIQALEKLAQEYKEHSKLPGKRFVQTSERSVDRYASMLKRIVVEQTRAGDIEGATAVQAAVKAAESWQITPPDNSGLHFLSRANLEVVGNEKATKLGIDLLVNIEKTGVLYQKQIDQAFERYAGQVKAARKTYRDALGRVLATEQRAGRLQAVQEIQGALKALEDLPEVKRPEVQAPITEAPENALPKEEAQRVELPQDAAGVYMIYFNDTENRNNMFRAVLMLHQSGCYVLGRHNRYNRTKPWDIKLLPMEMVRKNGNSVVFKFDTPEKQQFVFLVDTSENADRESFHWSSVEDYQANRVGKQSRVYKIGRKLPNEFHVPDGNYIMDMRMRQDREGNRDDGVMKYYVNVVNGYMFKTMENDSEDDREWEVTVPMVFRPMVAGNDLTFYPETIIEYRRDYFIFNKAGEGEVQIRYWWDSKNRSEPPSMVGKLVPVKD